MMKRAPYSPSSPASDGGPLTFASIIKSQEQKRKEALQPSPLYTVRHVTPVRRTTDSSYRVKGLRKRRKTSGVSVYEPVYQDLEGDTGIGSFELVHIRHHTFESASASKPVFSDPAVSAIASDLHHESMSRSFLPPILNPRNSYNRA